MNFTYTDEQQMLRDSAAKYLADHYDFHRRLDSAGSERGFSDSHWQTFAELGWLGFPFDEAVGGFGGTATDIAVLAETLGAHLVVEPFIDIAVAAGSVLARCATNPVSAADLELLISGEKLVALAYAERGHSLPGDMPTVKLVATEYGWELSGEKKFVRYGRACDQLLVTAQTPEGELAVVTVAQANDGINRRDYQTYDGANASDYVFDAVLISPAQLLAEGDLAREALSQSYQRQLVALCAEALGAMQTLLDITVEYTKQRQQFGQPLAKFQVLKHRMVNMYLEVELTRSLLQGVASDLDTAAGDVTLLLSALKVRVIKASRFVGQSAIQLHGGIGTTNELNVSHFFKRLTHIEVLMGGIDYHLANVAERALASH